MKYDYAYEKVRDAVESLIVSPLPLQDRIANAYMFHLMLLTVKDLPEQIQVHLQRVEQKLARTGPEGHAHPIPDTARQLTDDEAGNLARQMLHMLLVLQEMRRERTS
jgi:hypothetical protein